MTAFINRLLQPKRGNTVYFCQLVYIHGLTWLDLILSDLHTRKLMEKCIKRKV